MKKTTKKAKTKTPPLATPKPKKKQPKRPAVTANGESTRGVCMECLKLHTKLVRAERTIAIDRAAGTLYRETIESERAKVKELEERARAIELERSAALPAAEPTA